jgi:glucokinase
MDESMIRTLRHVTQELAVSRHNVINESAAICLGTNRIGITDAAQLRRQEPRGGKAKAERLPSQGLECLTCCGHFASELRGAAT